MNITTTGKVTSVRDESKDMEPEHEQEEKEQEYEDGDIEVTEKKGSHQELSTTSPSTLTATIGEDKYNNNNNNNNNNSHIEHNKESSSWKTFGFKKKLGIGELKEEYNEDFSKAVEEARQKLLPRAQRFLHQVHYDDNYQAFSGWRYPEGGELASHTNIHSRYVNSDTKEAAQWFAPNQPHRRVIFIDMKIKRISDIDTTKECFRAAFHYYLTWLATREEYEDYEKWEKARKSQKSIKTLKKDYQQDNQWLPSWIPSIELVNSIKVHYHKPTSVFKMKSGDSYRLPKHEHIGRKKSEKACVQDSKSKHTRADSIINTESLGQWGQLPLKNKKEEKLSWDIFSDQLGFDPSRGYWIRVQYEADAIFSEELELESFPFDCQDFTIIIKMAEKGSEEADLLPFPRVGEFLTLDRQYSVTSEWNIRNVITEFYYTNPQESRSLQSYAAMAIHVKAARVWASYMTEFFITFGIFALGLGAFALDPDSNDLGNRLAYCAVFLLADVGSLQLVSQKLPKIQYITLLDGYTFSCFLFLFAVTVWTCVAGTSINAAHLDNTVFWCFFIFFLIFHIFWMAVAWVSRKWERGKLIKTGEELQRDHIERKVCFNLCCVRRVHNHVISLQWERDQFLGEVNDIFKKENAYQKDGTELVAYGNVTKALAALA